MQILDTFSAEKKALSLTQLSQNLNLPRATVLRLCSTLVKYRFLKQDPKLKQYSLDLRLFELGSIVFNSFSLRTIASHHLSQLQIRIGATIFLGIIDNDELLYIDKIDDPENPITFTSKIGTRRAPFWGMVGPAIMAYFPESEIERILQKFPLKPTAKKSFIKKEELLEYLRRIRKQGYAFDDERAMDGISGIAAPVYNLSGKVIGAVGVAFISSSVDSKAIKKLAQETIATAHNISRDMGYLEKNEQTT
ncbi:MAG: IclR family transcriptional regulator [Spirochaetes bacterium]|nr:IclR family transcriptional regulator [Spirochaetota bacterium]